MSAAGPRQTLHVAFAIPHLGRGGAERCVLRLARGLMARGHTVDFLVFERRIDEEDEIPSGARVIRLAADRALRVRERIRIARTLDPLMPVLLRGGRLIAAAGSVADYVRRESPDCIVPSLAGAKIAVLLGCLPTGSMAGSMAASAPVVIPIMHSNAMNRSWGHRRFYARLFPAADRVVAVSGGVARSLVRDFGLPRDCVETIHNPVVGPDIDALARESPDHPWMSDGGSPVILAAGRLVDTKDLPTLFRACRRVFAGRPGRLLVLGDGPSRRRLERLLGRMGMADRVSLTGWVANPYAFMSRASAFVLSSRIEGLPSVLIEALACGCPCASTDCPDGPAEILGDGRIGPLVPPGDDAALAAAIELLLDAPPDPDTLRARARHFSFDAAVGHYERLIVDLVRSHRR